MPRSFALYLEDLVVAADKIFKFTAGMDKAAYENNELVQAAVERQFSIIGEALAQMRIHYPALMKKVTDGNKIVGFRNVLVHQYLHVDVEDVWFAVTAKLVGFRQQILQLQQEERAGNLTGE